ncbi:unnamed protein product [Plutella xylostella]|uniref:(diamondback moth) hypothetical protein n=1 Tax=Plutella xylostella TaxID=51655 RepID=A0A8S4G1N5_PLUXY|nr:unnamed protein product [Plutella xylostella]
MDNEGTLSVLINQRGQVKGLITKLYNDFVDLSPDTSLSQDALTVKEERLKQLFGRYENYNLQIIGLDPSDREDVDAFEDKYVTTLAKIKSMLRANALSEPKMPVVTSTPTALPQISVPIFTGKYSDYKTFIGLFNSLVDNNRNLENIQKFYYLRSFVSDEPFDLIKNLPMIAESYDEGLKIIHARYDNQYKIRNEHLNMLLDLQPISKSTASNIRQFVSNVKQQLAALKNLDCKVDEWDPLVLCVLLRKLDLICNREFQLTLDLQPSVDKLIAFLERRASALENSEQPHLERTKMTCGIGVAASEEPPDSSKPSSKSPAACQILTLLSNSSSTQVLLPTARVKLVGTDGTVVYAKALLDSGSQTSFCNRRASGIAKNSAKKDKIPSKLPQAPVDMSKLVLPPNITLADRDFGVPSDIHILMGADVFFQVLLPLESTSSATVSPHNAHHGSLPAPTIVNTKFGHIIAGNTYNHSYSLPLEKHCLFCKTCDSDITETISNFWQAESVPEVFTEKFSEHNTCEQIFKENNRFEVALPLKLPLESVNETLGDSLHFALKRFHNLEKRLQKDSQLNDLYKKFIAEYLALDHASVINIEDYDLGRDPTYFLPHHPVIRMDKRTTKCRTVFDGGMLSNKKVSLNDLQLNGPVVQRDLFDIVILFRLEKYIIISDIKHMFRAISLKPEHRPLQNILWRDSPDKPIDCIQLKTLTYGLKSSSYLATRCLIELAERYGDEFPKAAFVLKNQTYVDDILATADTLDSLIETKKQICSLLELGGFQLHKWSSNAPQVLHDIPIQNQYFDKVDLQEDNVCLKTLGINYDIKSDSLTLSAPRLEKKVPATKREILSFISKFFDPVGLAGPIVVGGKAIMQKVWKEHVGWDSPLSDPLMKEWNDFYNSLNIMGPIVISRFAHLDNSACIQLVGFVDASSSTAYGCCLYLRVVDTAGNVSISLLSSKSRVNPIKKELTVPRLELNAAVLLAKLAKRVHDILSLKVNVSNVVLYSDSQIVLAWIATNVVTLNTYVANRVLLITQLTCGYTWAYVSTEHNPADCLSRGVAPHELQQHPLWWTASPCLHERDYFVPTYEPFSVDALPELRLYAELPMAMSRPKWKNVRDNLQIGQLVILRENNTPPMYWPMARITKVFPGTDNLVRAVEVRTSNGHTHKRSVTRMCALPVDDNGDK